MTKNATKFAVWLAYGFFIVYGSLIPFEIRQYSFPQAVKLFRNIPYLNLDAVSRADWIANILLYIPFAYLGLHWLMGVRPARLIALIPAAVIFFVGLWLAVSVEFLQIFFKPRTVSLNDLLAEIIGLIIGIIIFFIAGKKLSELWREVATGSFLAIRASIILYLLAFFAITAFPFDFVMSTGEITAKLQNPGRLVFFAADCGDITRCLAGLVGEAIIVVPLGIFLAITMDPRNFNLRRTALYFGLILGAVIEVLQFFLISGTSQGLSILAKGIGMLGGVHLVELVPRLSLKKYEDLSRPLSFLATLIFLVVLMVLNKWFTGRYVSWEIALQQLRGLHFTPFYYHYFSSEAAAVSSLIVHFAMYMPVGLLRWFWCRAWWRQGASRRELWTVALLGVNLAIVMEAGKLFVAGKHPDPTDVLIAGAAAVAAYSGLFWLQRILHNNNILQRQTTP